MIERQHGEQTLICDECQDELGESFPKSEFSAMVAHAKAEGWSIKPEGQGGWWHTCPDCAGSTLTPLEKARKLFSQ